jgi:hypothetical protein
MRVAELVDADLNVGGGAVLLPPVVRRVVGQRAAPAVDGRAEQRARGIPGPGRLAALLQAGSGRLSGTGTGYPGQVRMGSASAAAGPLRR